MSIHRVYPLISMKKSNINHASRLPFAIGAIAQAKGVQTLQPIVLALLILLLAIWLMLPRIPKYENQS